MWASSAQALETGSVGAGEGNCIEEISSYSYFICTKYLILFYGKYSIIVFIFPEFLKEICVWDERNA